jgi:hypothetical protein
MSKRASAILFLFLAVLLVSMIFLGHISHPRTVARAMTPEGIELRIVQECNWSIEPFTTSFVYRQPHQNWQWFYYDHEDLYWGTGAVSLDTTNHVAVFYRGSTPAVTFHWDSKIFTLHRWNRTLTNSQNQMPLDWNPKKSVYVE